MTEPLVQWRPRVSPDGRWVAYESDESGQLEVYVQQYPSGGKWIVSSAPLTRSTRVAGACPRTTAASIAFGPVSTITVKSPTLNVRSPSSLLASKESPTKSLIAVSIPDTRSGSRLFFSSIAACASSKPDSACTRKACST